MDDRVVLLKANRALCNQTEKLDLPSISQVHPQASLDGSQYNQYSAKRSSVLGGQTSNPQIPEAYSSGVPSVAATSRTTSIDSLSYGNQYPSSVTSLSSHTSVGSTIGLKSPPVSPANLQHPSSVQGLPQQYLNSQHGRQSYAQYPESYRYAMNNQPPHNWDSHQSQMSNSQSYAGQPATAGGMPQYAHYQQHQQMMHPSSGAYAPSSGSYGHYTYGNGVTSPPGSAQSVSASMSSQMNSQLLPLPGRSKSDIFSDTFTDSCQAMATAGSSQHYVGSVGAPTQTYPQSFDTSGQVAPAGMKPRVTATLWEDEGSMCFQVEAKGVCVARRDGTEPCLCVHMHDIWPKPTICL